MTALRQRLRRILARLLNQRHLAVRAERRYQANRRRAFTAHNEQKRYEAQAELLERKGEL